jgi:formate hydrogenlyase transcriptional activator
MFRGDPSPSAVPAVERPVSEYQVLLEVAEAIALHRDLPALFHDLFRLLPRVVRFDSLSLILHQAEQNTMRLHIFETEASARLDLLERPVEASPSGLVWQTQLPLVIPDTERESRFPEAMARLREADIQSFCALPITTAHRRLGAMGFGSKRYGAYSESDPAFLALIARQVAVAVDNALGHHENHLYQQQLARERDRLRLLLDLNNSIVSNLDFRQLLRAAATGVRRVMRCDYASIGIPDSDRRQLRVYARNFSEPAGSQPEEVTVPIAGSASGEAFRTTSPVLLDKAALSRFDPKINPFLAMGFKSACFIPLIGRNGVVATLNVASTEDAAFTADELEFVQQVGGQVAIAIENALDYNRINQARDQLAEERLYLTEEIRLEHNFEEIIGDSAALHEVLDQAKTVAPTDSTVLILGETGTGKELIARAIHDISPRRNHTFVKVNCAAIPLGLLESELFGHEKGAFTGAIAQKIGRFELAHNGTLFLDEIGDIPLELQPKLLRVLQEQEFERLGSTRTIRVNVRIITATSQDLPAMVESRSFRSDLYYRLNIFPITVPPLRDRPTDIPLLVRYFVDKYARKMVRQIDTIPASAMQELMRYRWPGNVRELENLIERAVILTRSSTLRLPLTEIKAPAVDRLPERHPTLAERERQQILQALEESGWVLGGPGGAAERLGLKRTTLFYRMRRFGITRPTKRQPFDAASID